MNKLYLIAFFLLGACITNDENSKQMNCLKPTVMKNILVEKHLLIAQINSFEYKDSISSDKLDSLFNQLCLKNGSNINEFQESFDYYMNHQTQELRLIYDEVIKDLKTLEINQ